MTQNRSEWPRIVLFVMLILLFIALATGVFLVSPSGPNAAAVPFFSSVFVSCCFTGAWLSLGSSKLRFVFAALVPFLLGCFIAAIVGSELELFLGLTISTALLVAATTAVLRVCAGSFRRIELGERVQDGLRFGIRDLMVGTLVVAVLIVIGKAVFSSGFTIGHSQIGMVAIVSCCLACATVVNIWAIHGTQVTATKVFVIATMISLAAYGSSVAIDREWWFFPSTIVLCELCTIAVLTCLRLQGYRFVKNLPRSCDSAMPHAVEPSESL